MMKIIVFVCALIAAVAAKPDLVSAPLVGAAPAVVTATSSQYYHRNFNGLAAAYVAAPAAYVAPAAPVVATSPYVAAPYVASPYVASPYVASPYVASPYVAASAPIVAV